MRLHFALIIRAFMSSNSHKYAWVWLVGRQAGLSGKCVVQAPYAVLLYYLHSTVKLYLLEAITLSCDLRLEILHCGSPPELFD